MTDLRRLAHLRPTGPESADPDAPALSAFDLGATRGDGAFESVLVRAGQPHKLEAHLARMTRSAVALAIDPPAPAAWHALADLLVEDWPADVEGALKFMLTRGVEGGSAVTAYGTLSPVDQHTLAQRRDGIRVVTLSLGVHGDVRSSAPWLLGGVKYLSYAVHMAARRHAQTVGADDALYVTLDGELLEGSTSTIIWSRDGVLHTPPSELGILAGTTQALLFERAAQAGIATAVTRGRVSDLHSADEVWLVSSIRGAARVVQLDGIDRPDHGFTATMHELTGIPAQVRA